MSAEIVFALYRPKAGHEAELEQLVRRHGPVLRERELITDRPTVLGLAADGTFVEVFEWVSPDASRKAHEVPQVAQIWEAMAVHGSFAKLGDLIEAKHSFPHFKPL